MRLPDVHGRVAYIFDQVEFDVDQIIGVENVKLQDLDELARIAMRTYDPDFVTAVRPGDLLVGSANFGYGHPHHTAMKVMRHLGVGGVVAESFFPSYFQNEINMGFPQIICSGIVRMVERWDMIEVKWSEGLLVNHSRNVALPFEPLSARDQTILSMGGLIPWLKQDIANERNQHQRRS